MAEWPLAGRDRELQLVRGLMSQDSSGVMVAGPAGVGKTRLAREALHLASGLGWATAQAKASESAGKIPFGAFAQLRPPVEDSAAKDPLEWAALLKLYAGAVMGRAEGRRLALHVDDCQLLDDASATLLHALVSSRSIFLIGTLRTDATAPDPVTALWKDDLVDRVDLGLLPTPTVDELLRRVLGSAVDPATVEELMARSEGNALFLRELVLGALQDGALEEVGGVWSITGPLAPSHRLSELIEARLSALTKAEADFVEFLSFAEHLGQLEIDRLGAARTVEALERNGWVSSRRDGLRLEVRLAHPLYGDVVRRQIPVVQRGRIARELADILESTGAKRRDDTLRIATWRLEAGRGRPELLLDGARLARWHYNFPLARDLARAAVAAGAGFEARLLVVKTTALAGSSTTEAELADLAATATTDDERCRAAHLQIDLALGSGDIGGARQFALGALEKISGPVARTEILARASLFDLIFDGPRAAAKVAVPLLDVAEGRGLVWAALTASDSMARLGRPLAALLILDRGDEAYAALPDPPDWYPSLLVWSRSEALLCAGSLLEASQVAEREYRRAIGDRSPEAQAIFGWALSRILRERGRLAGAIRNGSEAVRLFRQLHRPFHERDCLIDLAWALAMTGQADAASEALAASAGLMVGPAGPRSGDLPHAEAWVAIARGDLRLARQRFGEAVEAGDRIGDVIGSLKGLHSLARLGGAPEVVDRLRNLADDIEGPLAAVQAVHVRGLAASDPEQLEEASISFQALGSDLLAAEAAADAAVAWRRRGEAHAAAAAEARAAYLAASCEGATTPALRGLDFRALLSPAEQKVALLAAAGHSNKEIAAAVDRSVRTVEAQLQRTYDKLGVSSRHELARSLGRQIDSIK